MAEKAPIAFDDFEKLDLRVATVESAEPHPNADRLLKLQVDLGDEKRQLLAGVRGTYELDDLVGTQIVMVANLEPRKIRGEESQGMLLAATDPSAESGQGVVLLRPEQPVASGSAVG